MEKGISFETARNKIIQATDIFNKEIISIADSCQDNLLIRPISVHSPNYTGMKENPIVLFIKKMEQATDGKFIYGEAISS
jgi:hypothetical protein